MRKEPTNENVNTVVDKARAYRDNFDYMAHLLKKLDLMIQKRVSMIRQQDKKLREIAPDPKLYVSHDEVDYYLQEKETSGDEITALPRLKRQIEELQEEIDTRVEVSLESGIFLALPWLARLYNLSSFEKDVILICLAPELHRKYDKIYVYLQDDIARKKPSIDLVLDLLCETEAEKWQARCFFSGHAPLVHSGIIVIVDDPHSPSGSSQLSRFLKLDPHILDFLLGDSSVDNRLLEKAVIYTPMFSLAEVLIEPGIKNRVKNILQEHFALSPLERKKLVLYFYGPYGVGKRDLALGICHFLNCPLIYLDMEQLVGKAAEAETLLRAAFREELLVQAILYLDNIHILLAGDITYTALSKSLARMAAASNTVTIMAGENADIPPGLFEAAVLHTIPLTVPPVQLLQKTWELALENLPVQDKTSYARELASRFRLTPRQIRGACQYARYSFVMANPQTRLTLNDLYAACRKQTNQKLNQLAVKIEYRYRWEDIVLEEEKIQHLKEICRQEKYRYQVFEHWGFHKKISHGKGLSVLFSGPPGTGKTMAAEVMAGELQLDLYKIDLSGVVSKYVGETEKNLARIFHEAETGNAILFFDEADALFGKRTEISDAHDRYANIEVSYLLQKMEEHEGIVILASNFRQNIDEAFTRRLRFIVDFPFPDEESRLRIWKTHFPDEAPLDQAVDFEFLARKFQVTGGCIRNIVLNAAFFAAQNGGVIEMKHILRGAQREYEKIGKSWDERNMKMAARV